MSFPGIWIFAYGSLIFRPGFVFEERRRARAFGYARRFYQGSPDHRGTEEHLGRVVTLVVEPNAICDGIAFRLPPATSSETLAALDVREQGGYARASLEVTLDDETLVVATTWIAGADNPYWLGPEPPEQVLERIRRAHGPSGPNIEYVLRLREGLREHGIVDPHVEELAGALG
jgi:glutathione-specific gamma-glutamylcyclotransferase